MEIRTQGPADISKLRSTLNGLALGEVQLREFGEPTDVLIRIERQAGGEKGQQAAINKAKAALGDEVNYRRTEFVGPKVGGELIEVRGDRRPSRDGGDARIHLVRFEWQFGVGAVAALLHDVAHDRRVRVIGAGIQPVYRGGNLDHRGIFDQRYRSGLRPGPRKPSRKFKQMSLNDLLNLSINGTLSRTLLTSVTTLIALAALYFFGGEVIKGFSFAMIWGVIAGTYSSIFIAVPLLVYMNLRRTGLIVGEETEDAPTGNPADRDERHYSGRAFRPAIYSGIRRSQFPHRG